MKKLEVYLGKKLLFASIATLLVILALDIIFSFSTELAETKYNYSASQAFIYVLLQSSKHVNEFTPAAILTGCLAGLGVIAANYELTAIKAAGVSNTQIFFMLAKSILPLIMAVCLLNEFIVPYSIKKAEINKKLLLASNNQYKILVGVWHKDDNEFIHFNFSDLDKKIYGISRFIFNEKLQLTELIFAEQAQEKYKNTWLLTNVTQHNIYSGKNNHEGFTTKKHNEMLWNIYLPEKTLKSSIINIQHLPITDLYQYSEYLQAKSIEVNEYQLAFWAKLLYPLVTLVLIFAGMQAISGHLRSTNLGLRIVVGIVCGAAFIILQKTMGSLSLVLNIHPAICLSIPIVVCFLASWLYSTKIS